MCKMEIWTSFQSKKFISVLDNKEYSLFGKKWTHIIGLLENLKNLGKKNSWNQSSKGISETVGTKTLQI